MRSKQKLSHLRATCWTGCGSGSGLWLRVSLPFGFGLALFGLDLWRHLQERARLSESEAGRDGCGRLWTACRRRVDPAHLVASAAVRSDAGAAALLCPLHLQVETSALSPPEAAGEGEASYRRVSSGDVQRLWIFVLLPPQSPHTVSRLGNAVRLLQHCNNESQAVTRGRSRTPARGNEVAGSCLWSISSALTHQGCFHGFDVHFTVTFTQMKCCLCTNRRPSSSSSSSSSSCCDGRGLSQSRPGS